MLLRKEFLNDSQTNHLDDYFKKNTAVFFDIETTGLSWQRSHLYLIGALAREEGQWVLRQWFLDKPAEEKEFLTVFSDYLARFAAVSPSPVLVHFNGNMFDIPYVRHKCEFYGLPDPFRGFGSLDIYRKIRPYQKILGLHSLKQKSVETYLGIRREDEKSGGELIGVYQNYLQTASGRLLDLLFLHNHDDVLGMNEIIPILAVPELFEGMPEAALSAPFAAKDFSGASAADEQNTPAAPFDEHDRINKYGSADNGGHMDPGAAVSELKLVIYPAHPLPAAFAERYFPAFDPLCTLDTLYSREAGLNKSAGHLQNTSFAENPQDMVFKGNPQDAGITGNPQDTGSAGNPQNSPRALCLTVPVVHTTMKHYFSDYRNYFYLPEEDQAIHKDVAVYVDPSRREKATKETCYQKKEGAFIPDPEEQFAPSFRMDGSKRSSWALLNDDLLMKLQDPEVLSAYAASLLRLFIPNPRKHRKR